MQKTEIKKKKKSVLFHRYRQMNVNETEVCVFFFFVFRNDFHLQHIIKIYSIKLFEKINHKLKEKAI